MNVTIIGAGNMARGIGSRLVEGGHAVALFGSGPEEGRCARRGPRASGRPAPRSRWSASTTGLANDVVVLALPFAAARDFAAANAVKLAGKIVVDITNPLNATYDGLVTAPGKSAAEEIANLLPKSNVVKAFNTNFAGTLVAGKVDGQSLDVFVAANDEEAKQTVLAPRQRRQASRHRRRQPRARPPARGARSPRHHPADAARPRLPERLEAGRLNGNTDGMSFRVCRLRPGRQCGCTEKTRVYIDERD